MSIRDRSFEGGFVLVEGAELFVPTAERESDNKGGTTAAAMLPVSNTVLDIRCVTTLSKSEVLKKGLLYEGLKIFPRRRVEHH